MHGTSTTENIVVLKGLEGHPPASELSSGQKLMAPFVSDVMILWWLIWITTLSYMIIRYLLVPLYVRVFGNT
jgi:hypothetical protein